MSFIIIIAGVLLKIAHLEGADTLMTVGFCCVLLFVILAIYEVNTSTEIDRTEKIMWTVGFLFMALITGLVYLLAGRKRVMRQLS